MTSSTVLVLSSVTSKTSQFFSRYYVKNIKITQSTRLDIVLRNANKLHIWYFSMKFNHFWIRKILWKAHRKYLCKKYSTLFSKKTYGMEYKKMVWDIFIRIRKTVKCWTESSWFPRFFRFFNSILHAHCEYLLLFCYDI